MRKPKILASTAAAAVLMLVGASIGQGAIPRLISFQGRLTDNVGTPLSGGYDITFRIFDAPTAGSACFAESQSLTVNSGLFNANIGGATAGGIAAACDFSVQYYLEIQVGTDSPMTPRIAFVSAPYAFRAELADNADTLVGRSAGSGSGQVPINSGTMMTGLNADKLDGVDTYNRTVGLMECAADEYAKFEGAGCDTQTTQSGCASSCSDPPACPAGCTSTSVQTLSCTFSCGETCTKSGCSPGTCSGCYKKRTCSCGGTVKALLEAP